MHAVDDDGNGIIHQAMRAAVTDRGVRLCQAAHDILIALDTLLLALLVFAVKLRANILPGGGRQNDAVIVDNGRREGVDFIQAVLQHLKLLDVNEILQLVFHVSSFQRQRAW